MEWNIGEAAGALAAFALAEQVAPAAVRERPDLLARFQHRLLEQGVPIAWLVDVGVGDAGFLSSQLEFMMRNIHKGAMP